MDQDIEENERIRKLFGFGRAGEPVPTVDPEDVKAIWGLSSEFERKNPGQAGRSRHRNFQRRVLTGSEHPGDYLPHTDDVGGATRLSGSLGTLDQR